VNVTVWPEVGWLGLYVKLAERVGTGETWTVWLDLTDPLAESVTVRVTL
jgi:hypothetical protein